jgi:transcriptional activator of cad operon
MARPTETTFHVGDWCVNPASGQISRQGATARLEARTMQVLLCLAERPGEVVSIDDLLTRAWPDVSVTADSVYQAVTSLRRALGDDPKHPTYIATVPKSGYRLVASVTGSSETPGDGDGSAVADAQAGRGRRAPSNELGTGSRQPPLPAGSSEGLAAAYAPAPAPPPRFTRRVMWTVGSALGVALLAFLIYGKVSHDSRPPTSAGGSLPQWSVAVLPFLDLTEKMNEEPFADGMTEELIHKLSKIPDVRVPSPTSSFYFKGKHLPVAEMAKALGVVYVLDGSVRKAGARLRVSARLIRADNGYVIWSETYDQSTADILSVQDEIAGEVTKALTASIGTKPNQR